MLLTNTSPDISQKQKNKNRKTGVGARDVRTYFHQES